MANNWKGTKLPVSLMGNQVYSDNKTIGDFENDRLPKLETIENARLFHNAINTIQECGLMPSELLVENKELKSDIQNFLLGIGEHSVKGACLQFMDNKERAEKSDQLRDRLSVLRADFGELEDENKELSNQRDELLQSLKSILLRGNMRSFEQINAAYKQAQELIKKIKG